jgi:hypothetical protein
MVPSNLGPCRVDVRSCSGPFQSVSSRVPFGSGSHQVMASSGRGPVDSISCRVGFRPVGFSLDPVPSGSVSRSFFLPSCRCAVVSWCCRIVVPSFLRPIGYEFSRIGFQSVQGPIVSGTHLVRVPSGRFPIGSCFRRFGVPADQAPVHRCSIVSECLRITEPSGRVAVGSWFHHVGA